MKGRLRVRRSSSTWPVSSRPPWSRQLGVTEASGIGVGDGLGVAGAAVSTEGVGGWGRTPGVGVAGAAVVGIPRARPQPQSHKATRARGSRIIMVKRKPANRRMAAGRRGRLLGEVYVDCQRASSDVYRWRLCGLFRLARAGRVALSYKCCTMRGYVGRWEARMGPGRGPR